MSIKSWIKSRYQTKYLRKGREYLHHLIGLIGTMCLAPFRSRTDLRLESIRQILLIRLDRIGDMVLSTPLIEATRAAFPKAKISLLLAPYTKPLVVNNPHLDQIFEYDVTAPVWRRLALLKCLRQRGPDLAIVMNTDFKSGLIAFLSGAKYRVGGSNPEASFFFTHTVEHKETPEQIRHFVEMTFDYLRVLGVPILGSRELSVSITSAGEAFAERFCRKHQIAPDEPIVAIHPGSRQPYIRWKTEGFAEVADAIIETYGVKVLVIGGPGESDLIEVMLASMRNRPIVMNESVELTELISVLNRCHLFIGNSTGTMHIAAALKVPVIAIFGSIHPRDNYQKWRPYGEGHQVVRIDPGCPVCHPGDCKTYHCMGWLQPHHVLSAVEKQLKPFKV